MWHRFVALFRLGVVDLVKNDGPVQLVQVHEGDLGAYGGPVIAPDLPHVTEFGFANSPPPGADVLMAASQGDRTRSIVIGTSHPQSRPRDLQEGDACLFDARGARVWLTKDGLVIDGAGLAATVRNVASLTITSAGPVTIDSPSCHMTGDLTADGTIRAGGNITGANAIYARGGAVELAGLRDTYDGHTHGGVKAGTDTTAGPNQKA